MEQKIYESIGNGQYNKKPYSIHSIFNRESSLMYWYIIIFNDTYNDWTNNESEEKRLHIEHKLIGKATDIRKLPNYKKINGTLIIFHRKDTVVPLIKEAVRKGYISPI